MGPLSRRTLTLSLAAAALIGGAALLTGVGRTAQQVAPPAVAPVAVTQYALLTRAVDNELAPRPTVSWEFQDSQYRYNGEAMGKLFGLRGMDDVNKARIVTLISALGWDLVSYTDAPVHVSADVFEGSSGTNTALRRTEQWWFRKR